VCLRVVVNLLATPTRCSPYPVPGIVQALMMTKHMLFVGFSLQDDNFHRLFDSVQRARRSVAASGTSSAPARRSSPMLTKSSSFKDKAQLSEKLGTVVCLEANTLQQELWGEHLDFVFMDRSENASGRPPKPTVASGAPDPDDHDDASTPVPTPNLAELSRQQEIFLDYLSSQCNRLETHNLLNPRFAAQLTPQDLALHDALQAFMADLPPLAQKSSGFVRVDLLCA
jgi:hypothetical protein